MKTQQSRCPRSVFEQSLPIVAAALGRLCGVAIEFGAHVPATDGKTIYLPMPKVMTAEEELKTLGLICHEAGHLRFSDFKYVTKRLTPLERAIDNALEDTRIEMGMGRLYPGAERLFEKAHASSVKDIASWPKFDEQKLLPLFLLAVSSEKLLRRKWLTSLTDKLRAHMCRAFGSELTDKLAALALEVKDAADTAAVVSIRKRIMQLLRRAAANDQYAYSKTRKARDKKAQGSKEEEGSASADGKYSSESGTTTSDVQSGEGMNFSATPLQRLLKPGSEKIENPLDLSKDFEQLQSSQCVSGLKVDFSGRLRPVVANEAIGVERLKRAREDSVSLRLALRGLVQAKARTGRVISNRGRRLSANHLCRLVVSDARIFQQRSERQAPNTAVHVLLDMSGSMGIVGGDLAVRSSLGLVLGLESISGVNPALTVFPGSACGHSEHAVCTVLKHGERLQKVTAGQIGGISSWGGTPIQQALQAGGFALAACKESKKALILITDGRVGAQANSGVIEELRKAGIHVLGIQIGDFDDLKKLPIDSANISSVSDLQQVLFGFAKKLLL